MNRELLEGRLRQRFGGTEAERRVVARQAVDLHDSGRYAEVRGVELAVDDLLAELREAPDDLGLVERWNWWVGALELAHGGFEPFRVRRYRSE